MGAHSNLGVFSDAQSIAAAGYSTNFIDLGVVKSKIGVGKPIYLCIRTNTAPTQAEDTLSIELRCSATNDATNLNGTENVVCMPLAAAAAAEVLASDARLATAGKYIFRGTIPYECNLRYAQLYYNNTVSTGVFVIDAWLSEGPPSDHDGVGTSIDQVVNSNVGNP